MAAARDGDDIHSFLSASGVRLQRPSPRSSVEVFSNSHASLHYHCLLLTSPPMWKFSCLKASLGFWGYQPQPPLRNNPAQLYLTNYLRVNKKLFNVFTIGLRKKLNIIGFNLNARCYAHHQK